MSLDDTLAPRARYILMVDHFAATDDGKPILMGIFDRAFIKRAPDGRLIFNAGWLAAQFECSLAAGTQHTLEVVLVDEQGVDISRGPVQDLGFYAAGEGLGLRAGLAVRIGAIVLPTPGYYEWRLNIDGTPVGTCPLIVTEHIP